MTRRGKADEDARSAGHRPEDAQACGRRHEDAQAGGHRHEDAQACGHRHEDARAAVRMSGRANDAARAHGRGHPEALEPARVQAGFVLNVFKQSPWTSHDAVQRVRRILRLKKVGHTGTLDPFATGVLICCVGRATKLSNLLMDLPKQYEGWMRFGIQTSTGDRCGELVREWSDPVPPLERLRAAARAMEGEIQQVPPMVSALKHEGQRLYKLARRGIVVERKARPVTVESFVIEEVADRRIRFAVRCARGTYVRTLVEDFGAALGAGAHVEELCRTRIGAFSAADAVRLEDGMTAEDLTSRSISMTDAIAHLPAWRVPTFWAGKLRRGHTPPWIVLQMDGPPNAGQTGRLVSAGGELIALGRSVPVPGPADRPWQEAQSLELIRVI